MGATASAAIWASTWIGVGYLISSAIWSGGGSGILAFTVIVAASMIASLSVLIRPATQAITAIVRSLRVKASAKPADAGRHTDQVGGNRRSA